MATMVASMALSGVQPRGHHVGVQSVTSVYSLTATLSAGDIIQMCKLPDNARVTGCWLGWNVSLGAGGQLNVGTDADADKFIMSASGATAGLQTLNNPAFWMVNDVSDAAATRYTTVNVQAAGTISGTKSGAISLTIAYTTDQPTETT